MRERFTERDRHIWRERPLPFLKHSNNDMNVWRNEVGFRQPGGNFKPSVQPRDGRVIYFNKGIPSFFFSNFPDKCGSGDMWKMFIKWGSVREVSSPPMSDKFGRRFSFVRYKDIQNLKGLEVKLDNI